MKNGAYVTPPILSSLHHTLNKPSLSWPTCVEHHKSMLLTTMIHYVGEEGEDVAVHRRAPFHPSPFPLTPDHYLITLIRKLSCFSSKGRRESEWRGGIV
jgi:hypothetical protein